MYPSSASRRLPRQKLAAAFASPFFNAAIKPVAFSRRSAMLPGGVSGFCGEAERALGAAAAAVDAAGAVLVDAPSDPLAEQAARARAGTIETTNRALIGC